MNPQYAYVLGITGQPSAVFTWPNCVRKFIRDVYTRDGELHLPPPDRLTLTRTKVNPRAGAAIIIDHISIEEFMSA